MGISQGPQSPVHKTYRILHPLPPADLFSPTLLPVVLSTAHSNSLLNTQSEAWWLPPFSFTHKSGFCPLLSVLLSLIFFFFFNLESLTSFSTFQWHFSLFPAFTYSSFKSHLRSHRKAFQIHIYPCSFSLPLFTEVFIISSPQSQLCIGSHFLNIFFFLSLGGSQAECEPCMLCSPLCSLCL